MEDKSLHHKEDKKEEKTAALERERDEYLAGWQRAKADLINFKRETRESLAKWSDLAELGFVRKLLPVLDALEEGDKKGSKDASSVLKLMLEILKNEGVSELVPEGGGDFDPEVHEAIDGEGTKIAEVYQKGYRYKHYIIRPAKVKVKE